MKDLNEEVRKIEGEYISANRMFTAVDIGNELKSRGVNARQRDISPIVREHFSSTDMYADAGYTRTMVPVKDGSIGAYLYFNIKEDPQGYSATNQDALPYDPKKPMFQDDDKAVKSDAKTSDQPSDLGSIVAQSAGPVAQSAGPQTVAPVLYVGSKKKEVYHTLGCRYAKKIKLDNMMAFDSSLAAVEAEYRKCRAE